jgi:hypothetical protein
MVMTNNNNSCVLHEDFFDETGTAHNDPDYLLRHIIKLHNLSLSVNEEKDVAKFLHENNFKSKILNREDMFDYKKIMLQNYMIRKEIDISNRSAREDARKQFDEEWVTRKRKIYLGYDPNWVTKESFDEELEIIKELLNKTFNVTIHTNNVMMYVVIGSCNEGYCEYSINGILNEYQNNDLALKLKESLVGDMLSPKPLA